MTAAAFPSPPWPRQSQSAPGSDADMKPRPDHGEHSYRGAGLLADKIAIITGADSGIGRAVAIAFAREGADLVLAHLDEQADMAETEHWVTAAGRAGISVTGDLAEPDTAGAIVRTAMERFGRIDIVVNCAGHQVLEEDIEKVAPAAWRRHFDVNVHGLFYLFQAASPHLKAGSSVIVTSSQNAIKPLPTHVAYAATKAAIDNFAANMASKWAKRGVRVNMVLPGATWTPLIASSTPADPIVDYGADAPMQRPAQPAELASAYVMLASDQASYTSGARLAVTGGTVLL